MDQINMQNILKHLPSLLQKVRFSLPPQVIVFVTPT